MLRCNPPSANGGKQIPCLVCSSCGRALPAVVFYDALSNTFSSMCRQCSNYYSLRESSLSASTSFDISSSKEDTITMPVDIPVREKPACHSPSHVQLDPYVSVFDTCKTAKKKAPSASHYRYVVPRSVWTVSSQKRIKNKKVDVFCARLLQHRSSDQLDTRSTL